MNSISVLAVLTVLAVCALSHPTDESTSQSKTESAERRSVESEVDVTVEEVVNEKMKKTGIVSHPTVKCEHIHVGNGQGVVIEEERDENHVCYSHCVTLGSEYREGKCLGGLCHCEREASPRGYADRVPTVKCPDLVPVGGETQIDNEEACKVHCKTLGGKFGGGKCEGGVCTCRVF